MNLEKAGQLAARDAVTAGRWRGRQDNWAHHVHTHTVGGLVRHLDLVLPSHHRCCPVQ
jgi:hypothetical protein